MYNSCAIWKFREQLAQAMRCCVGPGQRERVDRSLVPTNIRVVQGGGGGGQRRPSTGHARGGGRGGRGGGMMPRQQAMIPTGIQQQQPARHPVARPPMQPSHNPTPTGERSVLI